MRNPESGPACTAIATADPRFPKVGRRPGVESHVVHIGDVPFGGKGFAVIAGPCAVESATMIHDAAQRVATLGADVLRGGAFKPRTSPYSFQGLGLDGLSMMREAADAQGIPLVTEVLSPELVEAMDPHVDAFQVGARNMQNMALLQALGETDKPVLLKRNFGATATEWLLAAEHIATAGNDRIILCERGIRSFGDETRFTLDIAGALWAQDRSRLPVIIDPSHAIGLPALIPRAAAATLAAGLDGLIVEVHPTPADALCDGSQALTPDQFDAMMADLETLAARRPLIARENRQP